jgi:hypothetical protein
MKIDSKNSLYPQIFHRTPGGRIREITVEEQFKLRNLELFDPVAREQHRLLPATIHTQTKHTSSKETQNANRRSWLGSGLQANSWSTAGATTTGD